MKEREEMKLICPYENVKCTRKIKGYCCADKNFECAPKKEKDKALKIFAEDVKKALGIF